METVDRNAVDLGTSWPGNCFTSFFRNGPSFLLFASHVLPQLAEHTKAGEKVSIWSAGCSDGREAYSLAMMIANAEPEGRDHLYEVYGTDLRPANITKAKAGCFSAKEFAEIERFDPGIAHGHFTRTAEGFAVGDRVRKMTRFEQMDLLSDWPEGRQFEVIFLRNVMAYLPRESWGEITDRIKAALKPAGCLFGGTLEPAIFRQRAPGSWRVFQAFGEIVLQLK